MEREIIPHGNDILMGRGGRNNQHVGNEQLRAIARGQRDSYRLSSKKGKSHISREIVAYVRSMDPPGRFLKKDAITGEWEDVGDDTAREKVSQVLRDAVAAMHDSHSSSSDDGDGVSSGGEVVTPYTSTSKGTNYQRRADSAPTVVMSTPPSAPTSSRYGRQYIPSSRRSSSTGDTTRLRMTRSGQRRSYSPSQVVSMNPSYYHSPSRQLHSSSDQHRESHHYPHYHQHGYELQQQQYGHEYADARVFDPPPPRQRHYSAPPAVAPVVSHDDIPHSPIQSSVPKKQRREEHAYHPGAYSYEAPSAAAAASVPQGVYSTTSVAAAVPEPEDEFDLFDGSLLRDESHLKTDRSKRGDNNEEGPCSDLSSKTF